MKIEIKIYLKSNLNLNYYTEGNFHTGKQHVPYTRIAYSDSTRFVFLTFFVLDLLVFLFFQEVFISPLCFRILLKSSLVRYILFFLCCALCFE